ncbi:MAG TPA: DNA-3-methyladenine glycosylase I [Anaerolineaceae bacterium]|jgi:DNA-3-methyladenine glycosylase I
MTTRCGWALGSQQYLDYHDLEWGLPQHDDQQLFEMLLLEGAQAGLSWALILKRRDGYRAAFDHFDAEKIAGYDETKIQELLLNPAIIRNRLKVRGFVQNARATLQVRAELGSLDRLVWQFVDGVPRQNTFRSLAEIPPKTAASDAMSKELQRRGFTFVGSTICYAFMQSVGMVNDHVVDCFRWREVQGEKS